MLESRKNTVMLAVAAVLITAALIIWSSSNKLYHCVKEQLDSVATHEAGPFLRNESQRLDGFDSAVTKSPNPPRVP